MANKSAVMASSLIGEAFESVDVEFSDSDSWQVVDPSDSDEGNFTCGEITTDDDGDSDSDGEIESDEYEDEDDEVVPDVDDLLQHPFGSPSSDTSMQSLLDEIAHHCQELQNACETDQIREIIDDELAVGGLIDGVVDPYEDAENESAAAEEEEEIHGDDDDEEQEDDDDSDDSDLDDELVPKWLNNKFERQRMRKLGKRVYPKMKTSKRPAYMYNKPGCVHGKHGLGMKHNLMW